MKTINIEYEQHYTRPIWPSERGHQHITIHLDLPVDDLDAAQARAVVAGATFSDTQPQENIRVMFDPIGHPFGLFPST
ncbi:VOC family protein [Nocardia brasiliensis]|uniref:VOC family protein n=1 Tax=Nocardia brasiliensis TaxID=37326 RepID=UPI002455246D|nr:VOC family protein [Nocardia brasiliensis]